MPRRESAPVCGLSGTFATLASRSANYCLGEVPGGSGQACRRSSSPALRTPMRHGASCSSRVLMLRQQACPPPPAPRPAGPDGLPSRAVIGVHIWRHRPFVRGIKMGRNLQFHPTGRRWRRVGVGGLSPEHQHERGTGCAVAHPSRSAAAASAGALPPPPRHRPRARFAVQMPLLQTSLRHRKSPRILGGASVRREEQDAPWRIRVRSAMHLRIDEKHPPRPNRCADEARLRPDSAGSAAAAAPVRLGGRCDSPASATRDEAPRFACSTRARCPSPAAWW
jgi:hypothetical protein